MADRNASLQARIDNSGTKSQLVIDGSVLVYAEDFEIKVKKAVPQGINPSICLVHATVREFPSPMKGINRPFHLTTVYSDSRWTSVQVAFQYDPEEGNDGRIKSVSADIDGL